MEMGHRDTSLLRSRYVALFCEKMLLRSGEKLNSKARDLVCETRTQVLFLVPYLMVECV